jgi:acetyl esterase/lipase
VNEPASPAGEVLYGAAGTAETLWAFPAAKSGSLSVLLIHGGNWSESNAFSGAAPTGESSKWAFKTGPVDQVECERLQKYGMAVFCVNYPLDRAGAEPVAAFPYQPEAIKKAVEWVEANAGSYNGSTTRIAFVGGSCGAHLAMLSSQLVNKAAKTRRVLGVAALSGPTDLVELAKHKTPKQELGNDLFQATRYSAAEVEVPGSTAQKFAEQYSPVDNVEGSTSPHFQLWDGGPEDIVKPYHQTEMKTALEAASVPVEYKEASKGHSFAYWGNAVEGKPVYQWIAEFLLGL